jgi:hypothetical protein
MIKSAGLTRRSLVIDDYHHHKKPWLSEYLFHQKWNEHKAFVRRAFYDMDVDVNVTGVETISNFEKICICMMVSRREFSRGTLAAIYDRSLASMSEYINEWMPKLGEVGADLSHLSLELDHNFLTRQEQQQCVF